MLELPIAVESRISSKKVCNFTGEMDKSLEQIKTGCEEIDQEVWNQVIENQKKGLDKRVSDLESELKRFKSNYIEYVSKILLEIDKIKQKQEKTFESTEYKGYADIVEFIDKIYELSKKELEG